MLRRWVAARERRYEARVRDYVSDLLDPGEEHVVNAPAAFVLPDGTWVGVAYLTDRAFLGAYNAGHRGPTRIRHPFDRVLMVDRRGTEIGLAIDDGRLVVVDLTPSPATDEFLEVLERELD